MYGKTNNARVIKVDESGREGPRNENGICSERNGARNVTAQHRLHSFISYESYAILCERFFPDFHPSQSSVQKKYP